MAACLLFFFVQTRHWPLVGDATIIHYLVLLMEHGMAPYRQIVDAQMPGAYLVDWAMMHTFGPGAVAMRCFDYALMLTTIAAMVVIAWPYSRYAGLLGGTLFALLHGRDGIPQAGERDLIVAVLLLVAGASAFYAVRSSRSGWLAIAAFCAITSATIKPTAILAGGVLIFVPLIATWRFRKSHASWFLYTLVGSVLPLIAVVAFLLRERAVPAFFDAVHSEWPYYATLGRKPFAFLLLHSFSPLLPLLCVAVVLGLLYASRHYSHRAGATQLEAANGSAEKLWEWIALYGAMLFSFVSYVAQGKGFPYHRYPFLAFLILLLMLHFTRAMHMRGEVADASRRRSLMIRATGAMGLCVATLVIAPVSMLKISRFDWRNDDYYQALHADLLRLGGSELSGHIQCLDTFSGCTTALYRMGLIEATGFAGDPFFWGPPGIPPAQQSPVIIAMRERFWQDLQRNPPRVFVVSEQVFPEVRSKTGASPDTFEKLQRWPQFNAYLLDRYTLVKEQDWTRPVMWSSRPEDSAAYRIYVRKK